MKKIIHVNKQNIAKNRIHGTDLPVVTCKTYKANHYGNEVEILGPSKVIYAEKCGRKPLSCGARVWVETTAPVRVSLGQGAESVVLP